MKFRVIQSDVFVDMVAALGANATPMPYGEVYSAIETGVIDGAENNWPSLRILGPLRGREVLHARRAPDRARGAGDVEDRLGQADARGPGDRAPGGQGLGRRSTRELWAEREKASEEKVRAAGVEIVNDIDKAPFIAAMGPVYEKYATTPELQGRSSSASRPSE